jgi:hypothetical protein
MTRVLSELLGAREPWFTQNIRDLEKLSGHRGTDIRLTSELHLGMQTKLHQLGLDHADTTGEELYLTLGERVKQDEQRFLAALGVADDTAADLAGALSRALTGQIDQLGTYALKPGAARKLLKDNVPKRTMKLLGYRSSESMLKHETPANLMAAAALAESAGWSKKMLGSYMKLKAVDFEPHDIVIEHPASNRWDNFAETVVASQKRHMVAVKELGSVVILPLPVSRPVLSALTTAVLAVQAINEVRAAGTYLKLHQMKPHFGAAVSRVVVGEPAVGPRADAGQIAGERPLGWHSVHRYFGRLGRDLRTTVLEPLVAAEDLAWDSAERVVAGIEPSLEFWRGTAHLGQIYQGSPVGLNLTDALISHANHLGFSDRILKHFRHTLESELMLRYLNHDKLEQMVLGTIQKRLAPELATVRN